MAAALGNATIADSVVLLIFFGDHARVNEIWGDWLGCCSCEWGA